MSFSPAGSRGPVAMVTSPRIDGRWPDDETPVVIAAMSDRGITAHAVPWYADVDWSAYRMAVIRSPSDLYWRIDEFSDWLGAVSGQTGVLNPPSVIRWNLDKHYLAELAGAGVPVTPTTYVECGEVVAIPDAEFVVKPVISGGALNTARYPPSRAEEAAAHVASMHSMGLGAMVQPYLDDVDERGECALVFFAGTFDHAVRKQAVLGRGERPDAVRESHPTPEAYEPSAEELSLARDALDAVPGDEDLVYARVDMAHGIDGRSVIMELELIDPVLFLPFSEGSAGRFARAIAQRL